MKIWSAEEANRALPQLREILSVLIEQNKLADLAREALLDLEERVRGDGAGMERELEYRRARLREAVAKVRQGVEQVERMGCQVKDLETGLVDFPGVVEGRQVLLCWQMGEPAVLYWHDEDKGFATRRLIPSEAPGR
jgi:hypothetical protein